MAQKSTDHIPARPQGLTEEQRACAGWVLGTIADTYAVERPDAPVDPLGFPIRVAVVTQELVGESPNGGLPGIARAARMAVGPVGDGISRGELSERLRTAALGLGCEWGDGGPVVPRIPGPRQSPEGVLGRRPQAVGR